MLTFAKIWRFIKYIYASILLIALLAQTCSRYLVMLDYALNKTYIENNLCENRNKPKCCCHGKCYLKKKLNKTDEQQNSPSDNSQKERNEVLFFKEEKATLFVVFSETIKTIHAVRPVSFSSQSLYGSVFHPPQA